MSLLTTLASVLFQPRPDLTNDRYLRTSWLLSPVAVLAAVLDEPVSTLLSKALYGVVPANLLPSLSTPAVLELRSQAATAWLLGVAVVLLAGACTVIAVEEGPELQATMHRVALLQGARVVATIWLLVVAAVQVGSLRQLGVDFAATASGHLPSSRSLVIAGVALLFSAAFACSLAAWRWGKSSAEVRTVWTRTRPPGSPGSIDLMALVTLPIGAAICVALWPLTYPIRLAPWLVDVTPEPVLRAQHAMEPDFPTGAIDVPPHRLP